jgi:hypothetical protein
MCSCLDASDAIKFNLVFVIACRSQWLCGVRGGSAAFRLLGIWVRVPPGVWMSVSCEYCVLSGRGLCVGLITRPESPTECGVSGCDGEASVMRRRWPTSGCCTMGKRNCYG